MRYVPIGPLQQGLSNCWVAIHRLEKPCDGAIGTIVQRGGTQGCFSLTCLQQLQGGGEEVVRREPHGALCKTHNASRYFQKCNHDPLLVDPLTGPSSGPGVGIGYSGNHYHHHPCSSPNLLPTLPWPVTPLPTLFHPVLQKSGVALCWCQQASTGLI